MSTNKIQRGDLITVPAPYDMVGGEFAKIGAALGGVAVASALSGADVVLDTEGIFELTKATGAAWVLGDSLYWDATAKKFTTTAAANMRAGVAADAAASGDAVGLVKLDGLPAGAVKLVSGEVSITGATGGDITTGLGTVLAVVASLAEDPALTGDKVTAALGGTAGHITLKVWKPTAANDVTPILATAAKKVDYVAIGI